MSADVRGERGAQDGHRVAHTGLVRHHAVDVALDEERPARGAHRVLGQVEGVERLPLLVEGGLRRVEVLRVLRAERAAPEGDDPSLRVGDRKDESPAEAIVVPGPRRGRTRPAPRSESGV